MSKSFCFFLYFFSNIYMQHCVKGVHIWSYSGLYISRIFQDLDWIRRDIPYLSVFNPNEEKCGKNADQNNSEQGHLLSSVVFQVLVYTLSVLLLIWISHSFDFITLYLQRLRKEVVNIVLPVNQIILANFQL